MTNKKEYLLSPYLLAWLCFTSTLPLIPSHQGRGNAEPNLNKKKPGKKPGF